MMSLSDDKQARILGQVQYLIVLIPELCTLTNFK